MIRPGWWLVGRSSRLRAEPRRYRLFGIDLVLFRSDRGIAALDDRCAHRSAPLSLGKIHNGCVECPYHGWRFDAAGVCREIPHAVEGGSKPSRIRSWHVRESQGYVFVSHDGTGDPYRFDRSAGSVFRTTFEAPARLEWVAENQLDVTHTSVLHAGWFRDRGQRKKVRAVVTRDLDRMQVEYFGENRPSGWVARLLAPWTREVAHIDRLLLPAVTQVEYRAGRSRFFATTFLTPVDESRTLCHAEISLRTQVPFAIVAPFLAIGAKGILNQDLRILRAQSETIANFGKRAFSPSRLDFYDGFIRENLSGEKLPAPLPSREEIELWI